MSRKSEYAVLLAGGQGTRLWPLSRHSMPKHLLRLTGEASLLQQTAERLRQNIPPHHFMTVTCSEQRFAVADQLRAIDPGLTENILVEPMGRNTLPAIAWAAAVIHQRDPNAIIGVFPADHIIAQSDAFHKAYSYAVTLAGQGDIITLGITPSHAATGYGYIRRGAALDGNTAYKVSAFVEKPDKETAQTYIQDGGYYWNAGIFVFQAAVFLTEVQRLQPDIYNQVQALLDLAADDDAARADLYERFPNLSIDYGIMEHTDKTVIVPVDMGWNDLGSWKSFYDMMDKDEAANVSQGKVLAHDTRSSLLFSDDGVIAAIGLENIAIIKTDDAVLVSDIHRVQEVKDIVAKLKKSHRDVVAVHSTVQRPWGTYTVLEEGLGFKIKRIVVDPQHKLSLQQHEHRAEHWVVVAGVAHVVNGDEEFDLHANESTFIPQGHLHRLENRGDEPLQIIEVQTGTYLGEDDITRFEDHYGRS